jgi:hypothetical protein
LLYFPLGVVPDSTDIPVTLSLCFVVLPVLRPVLYGELVAVVTFGDAFDISGELTLANSSDKSGVSDSVSKISVNLCSTLTTFDE